MFPGLQAFRNESRAHGCAATDLPDKVAPDPPEKGLGLPRVRHAFPSVINLFTSLIKDPATLCSRRSSDPGRTRKACAIITVERTIYGRQNKTSPLEVPALFDNWRGCGLFGSA